MKTLLVTSLISSALLASGCATRSDARLTDHSQPGPAVGNAIGTGVGAVAGNVAGAVVGLAEGASTAAKAPFNNERHIVRTWKEVKTSDGRTVKIPVDTEVDANGVPIPQTNN